MDDRSFKVNELLNIMRATSKIHKKDCGDDLIIEGTTSKLWLTRFWKVGLENNNLLL